MKLPLTSLLFHPVTTLLYASRRLPPGYLFELRAELDAVRRPQYAYGLIRAARQASALGIPRICAIEFGVAAGHGLLLIEKYARLVRRLTGVEIDVVGFDLETGLPAPADYRDMPYIWKKDFFKMDREALERRLDRSTRLLIGDVSDTVPEFLGGGHAPVGFVVFDMDFYSSTVDALLLFESDEERFLPRVFCYFDDIIGPDDELMNEYVGELLAIREFNQEHEAMKIAMINGLRHKRVFPAAWNEMVHVLHRFEHPLYNQYIYPGKQRQTRL